MAEFKEMYEYPQVNIAITFLDPLSFGIGFTLMTAGMLSRTRQGEGAAVVWWRRFWLGIHPLRAVQWCRIVGLPAVELPSSFVTNTTLEETTELGAFSAGPANFMIVDPRPLGQLPS